MSLWHTTSDAVAGNNCILQQISCADAIPLMSISDGVYSSKFEYRYGMLGLIRKDMQIRNESIRGFLSQINLDHNLGDFI